MLVKTQYTKTVMNNSVVCDVWRLMYVSVYIVKLFFFFILLHNVGEIKKHYSKLMGSPPHYMYIYHFSPLYYFWI